MHSKDCGGPRENECGPEEEDEGTTRCGARAVRAGSWVRLVAGERAVAHMGDRAFD